MIISSELTGKTYNTVDECLAAEEQFRRIKAEEEAKERLQILAEKKAEKDVIDAFHRYCDVIGASEEDVQGAGLDLIVHMMFGDWEDDDEEDEDEDE